jgi:hypothetical protein
VAGETSGAGGLQGGVGVIRIDVTVTSVLPKTGHPLPSIGLDHTQARKERKEKKRKRSGK